LDERINVGLRFQPAYAGGCEEDKYAQSALNGPFVNLEVSAHFCPLH